MEKRNPEGDSPMEDSLWQKVKLQVPPLRYPGFPVELGGVAELHAAFFTKAAHAAMSSAAWQEIRVRFGRDDKG